MRHVCLQIQPQCSPLLVPAYGKKSKRQNMWKSIPPRSSSWARVTSGGMTVSRSSKNSECAKNSSGLRNAEAPSSPCSLASSSDSHGREAQGHDRFSCLPGSKVDCERRIMGHVDVLTKTFGNSNVRRFCDQGQHDTVPRQIPVRSRYSTLYRFICVTQGVRRNNQLGRNAFAPCFKLQRFFPVTFWFAAEYFQHVPEPGRRRRPVECPISRPHQRVVGTRLLHLRYLAVSECPNQHVRIRREDHHRLGRRYYNLPTPSCHRQLAMVQKEWR